MNTRAALPLLLPLLLAACTGTEETSPAPTLILLTDGGATLRSLTPNDDTVTAPFTEKATQAVTGGVSVDPLSSGRRFALTLTGGLESRDANLLTPQAYATLPFTPCLRQTATSAARDRLLTLSECSGSPQRLALYQENGQLIWTALLPPALTVPGSDVPPVRLAVLRGTASTPDVAVVTRPRLGGGSEVLRAAPRTLGDSVAEVSDPRPIPPVRDLAPYTAGGVTRILAATDTGIQPLTETGDPDAAAPLTAFGTARYDRLWSGPVGANMQLAAWQHNSTLTGPLLLWDGARPQAAQATSFISDLRDVTLTPTGFMYTLTGTTLTSYDTLLGLTQNSWRARTLLSGLQDARSVTWVLPNP